MINELIEQIGGRERLEEIRAFTHTNGIEHCNRKEWQLMARALLAVLDAKPDFYIHRVEVCDTYGPEIELRAFNCQLDASKCRDDHGGEVIEAYTTPPAASVPDGWKIVPLEATPNMLDASWLLHGIYSPSAYRTMIEAAPKPGGDGG